MKIRPVGAELFNTDGQTDKQTNRGTDMTKLIVEFHNFANASKGGWVASKNKGIWNHLIQEKPEQ
jgi:hypothetical protein